MTFDARYVAARRVLLDALDALEPHAAALIVVGAQAVYLRTGDARLPIAPFTLDADLVLNPTLLGTAPELETAMAGARFELKRFDRHVEPGIWIVSERIEDADAEIPVDLIVPDGAAPAGGRRGVRLGTHGRRAARRVPGLEAALVDHSRVAIEALDPRDGRSRDVEVAGPTALLIAKAHKLADRVTDGRDNRLSDKDAVDVLRLMLATAPSAVAETCGELLNDPVAGEPSAVALRHLDDLFGRRGRPGIDMAVRALRLSMPAERVAAICLAYTRALREAL